MFVFYKCIPSRLLHSNRLFLTKISFVFLFEYHYIKLVMYSILLKIYMDIDQIFHRFKDIQSSILEISEIYIYYFKLHNMLSREDE